MKPPTWKMALWGILMGSLWLAAACAGGEVSAYQPSYPTYNRPYYYYPDLRLPEDDPQFWQQWQDYQGGG